MKKAVVIPAYKVAETIRPIILSIPETIDYIIVVDDKCPDSSGKEAERSGRKNVIVLYHEENRGVGGATVTGYAKALELGCEIIVKMDGDGQMDPKYIEQFIDPLIKEEADYTKGNRFRDFEALKSMPKMRIFGNSGLSFLLKMASGYWNVMDPTNGFTAIHGRVLRELKLEKISNRYFFESDLLINLNIVDAVVKDIAIPSKYGNENSSLRIFRTFFQFPPKIVKGLVKRIFLKYFIYDFNMASVYLLVGLPMFLVSVFYGAKEWLDSITTGIPKTAGTIMLVSLPVIISLQMLLQAIQIDINSVPKKK